MRIRGILHHSIGKASPGFFERGAANPAAGCDEQIHVPHVLKNMGHPAGLRCKMEHILSGCSGDRENLFGDGRTVSVVRLRVGA